MPTPDAPDEDLSEGGRLLADAGIVPPPPRGTPAIPGTNPHVIDLEIPPADLSAALLAQLIRSWGRPVIDPALPVPSLNPVNRREVRYGIRALHETITEHVRTSYMLGDWRDISDLLRDAASRMDLAHLGVGENRDDLGWYTALLTVETARRQWSHAIGTRLP